MKALAGADPDAKPDYRSQSLTELNKLEQKVILLNEMLDNVDVQQGERFVSGDAYDVSELHTILIHTFSAHGLVASIVDPYCCQSKTAKMDFRRRNR